MSKENNIEYSRWLTFYRGKGVDSEGRLIYEIHSWDNERLEFTHDYIQWLFPLRKKGLSNPNAPILDNNIIDIFKQDEELNRFLIKSFIVMLKFYGFEYRFENNQIFITKSSEWNERSKIWLTKSNHNFLRITRILTSLRILGLPDHAKSFFLALSKVYESEGAEVIEVKTFEIWQSSSGIRY